MVQFNGPHGKVTVAYLRQGGLHPPVEPSESFEGKTVVVTGCASGIVCVSAYGSRQILR
jgi:hypothetical protein